MHNMYDIAILGSGLAGSGLATRLSMQGWKVLLIERRHLPQHKVCGEFLSPESQASLHHLGLHDAVANLEPAAMKQAQLTTPAGTTLRVDLPGAAWGVSRFALDAALLDAAAQAGATVQMGMTALDVEAHDTGCAIATRAGSNQQTMQARTAVVACGRHPPAALQPSGKLRRIWPHQKHVGVKCHYRGLELPPQVELYLFPGGYVGLSPVEHGKGNLCLLATQEAFVYAGGSARAMLAAIRHWNRALDRRLSGGHMEPDSLVTVGAVDTAQPTTLWDTVARVGDAVTMIPPLCGDGMAMALRSAELCAPLAHDYLRGSISATAWEQRYSQVWHREFDHILLTGRALQTCLMQRGIGDMALLLGNLLPGLSRQMVRLTRGAGSRFKTRAIQPA